MKRSIADEGTARFEAADEWLHQVPAAAAIFAPGGVALHWNREAGELLGLNAVSAARMAGSAWLLRLCDAVERQGHGRVMISRRRGGRRVVVEVRARASADGSILALLQRHRRVAVQPGERRLQRVVRAAHERLRLITDVVQDHAILTLDDRGQVVSWNATAQRLTGYPASAIVRSSFDVLSTGGGPDVAELLARTRTTGRYTTETDIRRRDGTEFRANVTLSLLHEPDSMVAGYAVVLRDMTETLRAKEELRRSEEQLRHAQKMDAVGRLASGIAHDFNNVLTAIHGHVQFMLEDLPEDSASREDAFEVHRAAERATQFTRQLLTFARRQPSEPVALDLNGVITGIDKLLRRLIRADVSLEKSLDPVPPIFADPGQLEQVIVNLVVNARDSMPDGGVITVRTAPVRLSEIYSARGLDVAPGDYVQMTISDNGCGMSEDVQRQIFEPFFTTKPEGTGLGLSTVYGIVKQSGGHISVYSEAGVGTTFKVFLPVHRGTFGEPSAPRAATPLARPASATAGETGALVLLVEDDPVVRALARRTLESQGFRVLEAADGTEALEVARDGEHRIDVVVTDLMMPNMTGEELATRLATMRPGRSRSS
jgi:two-component system, cell cycle sensor histidine kinase and response regulator CckA